MDRTKGFMTTATPTLRPTRRNRARGKPPLLTSILTTTDFSPESRPGINYAASLAEQVGAELTLLHVVEPLPAVTAMPIIAQDDATVAAAARAKLASIASREISPDASVSCHVAVGKPAEVIVKFARRGKVDLIVLSTRGHTGLRRLVLGSTAAQVVRSAGCPVLTVPAKQTSRAFKLKTILVPIDFSNLSKDALPYARLLAEHFGAKIVLAHIVEPIASAPLLGDQFATQWMVPMMRHAQDELKNTATELRELTDAKVQAAVTVGKPFYELCQIASRINADMIVLTTHGRGGWNRLLLGSTAEGVVREATCPVMVVRELQRRLAD
jgi:nucleotide-binding universal stress UspA family protein